MTLVIEDKGMGPFLVIVGGHKLSIMKQELAKNTQHSPRFSTNAYGLADLNIP